MRSASSCAWWPLWLDEVPLIHVRSDLEFAADQIIDDW
jgi:hypothetical protein